MTSTIKVDNIKDQASTNIVNKCGTTINIGAPGDTTKLAANTIRSNALQNACGGNTISKCATTVTIGQSGDTVNLASGASQTGFGRTGTVDWLTTPKVTGDSPVTGVSGTGYFMNTTAGTITLNLPAGSAGDIISVADYAGTWQTYALTLTPNGSEKIGGANASVTLNTEGQSVTLIYVDAVQGWVNTMDSTSNVRGSLNMIATVSGACNSILTCGDYKTAVFKGPGTFCVTAASGPEIPTNKVDYVVIGGAGGGGGCAHAGGGGGGGFRIFSTAPGCNSPHNNSGASPNTEVTVTTQAYPITVGAGGGGGGPGGGGPGSPGGLGSPGVDSVFSTVTSAGGGAGMYGGPASTNPEMSGGSGGGQGAYSANTGSGNTPPTSPPQGNPGGCGASGGPGFGAGGGGGAGATGPNGTPGGSAPGAVGSYIANPFIGPTSSSYGTPGPVGATRYFAGGGGGGGYPQSSQAGAAPPGGGGGAGNYSCGSPGTANTGGGGGGSERGGSANGGTGGSGIVMIRYKFQ